jgi:mono/diheme cytochrome c family protein
LTGLDLHQPSSGHDLLFARLFLPRSRLMRIRSLAFFALCLTTGPAFTRPSNTADDVRKGHDLAALVCANCHVAAADQRFTPVLNPPAPSFESIAQRSGTTAESLEKFMTTTHRGLDNPGGMPNPYLMDYQVKQVVAYMLSLRK